MPGAAPTRTVFVTGGTGYIGRPLVEALGARGHAVRALVRPGSEHRLPANAVSVVGDALRSATYARHVAPADTLVQLVGTPHPSPRKAAEFRRVDLASGVAAVEAALAAGVRHLVYVSVARPAPVMHAYLAARAAVEARIEAACEASGLAATVLRPWYVLGPGHRWPYLLVPLYALGRRVPSTRAGAERLGLVTRSAMLRALVAAVEDPPDGVRTLDVPAIRTGAPSAALAPVAATR